MEESAKTLGGIKFSVWSPTEVRKFSVAEITALKHMKTECQCKAADGQQVGHA